jgi:RNase P protein component
MNKRVQKHLKRLTKEQAIVVSAYTGFLICDFADLHEAVENRMGRPILTHEFGNPEVAREIRQAFKPDFLLLEPEK